MRIAVNDTVLWFDVEGVALEPDGATMRPRPTVVLIHGGPGSYDHSYFKPHFSRLAAHAQVVYLDLRNHGRSARHDPVRWSFEVCADDVRVFCDALGIERPVVFGHSMGGIVAMLYGSRHPGHAAALVLQSTMARLDLARLADGFRAVAGDKIADLARADFNGAMVSEDEWARVFAAFGPCVPGPDELARRVGNPAVAEVGMERLRQFDALGQLALVATPTLVSVGSLDPVTPVAASQEIVEALPSARLEVIDGAGHFPWLDRPDVYWSSLIELLQGVG